MVRTAEHITGCQLPSLEELYNERCVRKSLRVIKDPTHPHNRLFVLLPSGKRYQGIKAKTNRLKNSFIAQAVRLLNKSMK